MIPLTDVPRLVTVITDTITVPLILAATLAAWVFCILYATLSHNAWARSKQGRHLMGLSLGLAFLGTFSILRRVIGEWEVLGGYDLHVTLVYAVLAYQLVNRCALLVLAHLKGERERKGGLGQPVAPGVPSRDEERRRAEREAMRRARRS